MNVLPAAIDLLVDRPAGNRRDASKKSGRTNNQRRARTPRDGRPPQLPLALPLGQRSLAQHPLAQRPLTQRAGGPDARPALQASVSVAPAPTLDVLAAARALWAVTGTGGEIVRLSPPQAGWPDALVSPDDTVVIATGGHIADGTLAAVRLRATRAVLLRRVYRSGEHVRLQPEDRAVPPLVVPAADIELMGPVLTILRRPAGEAACSRRTA